MAVSKKTEVSQEKKSSGTKAVKKTTKEQTKKTAASTAKATTAKKKPQATKRATATVKERTLRRHLREAEAELRRILKENLNHEAVENALKFSKKMLSAAETLQEQMMQLSEQTKKSKRDGEATAQVKVASTPAGNKKVKGLPPILSSKQVYDALSEYVIGQHQAKRKLSVAVNQHLCRMHLLNEKHEIPIRKCNVIICGPTGTGKTMFAKTIADLLEVPFVEVDANSLTAAGYVGSNIEDSLKQLIVAADGNVELAQRGVVFIDEVDKIAKRILNGAGDIGGEAVQQMLLKVLEGQNIDLNRQNSRGGVPNWFDTTNVLFICAGAFVGIQGVDVEHFESFGMIPEFMGRLPSIVKLESLKQRDLFNIMMNAKHSVLLQQKRLFQMQNITLEFEDEAVNEIAKIALRRKTGARGIQAIVTELMEDIHFELTKHEIWFIRITPKYVRERNLRDLKLRAR